VKQRVTLKKINNMASGLGLNSKRELKKAQSKTKTLIGKGYIQR
jgi:hypothetical protein